MYCIYCVLLIGKLTTYFMAFAALVERYLLANNT